MFDGLVLMQRFTAKAYAAKTKRKIDEARLSKTGAQLLEKDRDAVEKLEILGEGFENSNRKVELLKVPQAYAVFRELIVYYGIVQLLQLANEKKITALEQLLRSLPAKPQRSPWMNIGGQLMPASSVRTLISNIRNGKIGGWDEVHQFYRSQGENYPRQKRNHAFASMLEVLNIPPSRLTKKLFTELVRQAIHTREWMTKCIYTSREKDYKNPFRKMVYENEEEMEKVIGKLQDNAFIRQQQEELAVFKKQAEAILDKLS
jgi:hypothetical protein